MSPLGLTGWLNGSIAAPESQLCPLVLLDPIRVHTTALTDLTLRMKPSASATSSELKMSPSEAKTSSLFYELSICSSSDPLCAAVPSKPKYLLAAPVVQLLFGQMQTRQRVSALLMEHELRAHGRSLLPSLQGLRRAVNVRPNMRFTA